MTSQLFVNRVNRQNNLQDGTVRYGPGLYVSCQVTVATVCCRGAQISRKWSIVVGHDSRVAVWCNVTVLVPRVINLKVEFMSQYCSLQLWLMTDDGCCQVTVLRVPFSVNRGWFMACALCVSIFRLLFIDTEFRMLRLKAEDSAGRQHILTVKLKSKVRRTLIVHTEKHTVYRKDWIIFHTKKIIHHQMEYSTTWCWPTANPNPTGQLHQMHVGLFTLLMANQWFTSVPLNLGQTGEGVERHDNPLWLRRSTDKISPHNPSVMENLLLCIEKISTPTLICIAAVSALLLKEIHKTSTECRLT